MLDDILKCVLLKSACSKEPDKRFQDEDGNIYSDSTSHIECSICRVSKNFYVINESLLFSIIENILKGKELMLTNKIILADGTTIKFWE